MSAKGTRLTDEQRARISTGRKAAGNEALRGRQRPAEVNAKVSAALTGRTRPDISARLQGVPKSEATRAAISASLIAQAVPAQRRVPARDGDVRQAHDRVRTLVKRGLLPHPSTLPCTDCAQVWAPGLSRHEYDHHLGYAAEHHEAVEPVCSLCHHAREKSRGRVRKPSGRRSIRVVVLP